MPIKLAYLEFEQNFWSWGVWGYHLFERTSGVTKNLPINEYMVCKHFYKTSHLPGLQNPGKILKNKIR